MATMMVTLRCKSMLVALIALMMILGQSERAESQRAIGFQFVCPLLPCQLRAFLVFCRGHMDTCQNPGPPPGPMPGPMPGPIPGPIPKPVSRADHLDYVSVSDYSSGNLRYNYEDYYGGYDDEADDNDYSDGYRSKSMRGHITLKDILTFRRIACPTLPCHLMKIAPNNVCIGHYERHCKLDKPLDDDDDDDDMLCATITEVLLFAARETNALAKKRRTKVIISKSERPDRRHCSSHDRMISLSCIDDHGSLSSQKKHEDNIPQLKCSMTTTAVQQNKCKLALTTTEVAPATTTTMLTKLLCLCIINIAVVTLLTGVNGALILGDSAIELHEVPQNDDESLSTSLSSSSSKLPSSFGTELDFYVLNGTPTATGADNSRPMSEFAFAGPNESPTKFVRANSPQHALHTKPIIAIDQLVDEDSALSSKLPSNVATTSQGNTLWSSPTQRHTLDITDGDGKSRATHDFEDYNDLIQYKQLAPEPQHQQSKTAAAAKAAASAAALNNHDQVKLVDYELAAAGGHHKAKIKKKNKMEKMHKTWERGKEQEMKHHELKHAEGEKKKKAEEKKAKKKWGVEKHGQKKKGEFKKKKWGHKKKKGSGIKKGKKGEKFLKDKGHKKTGWKKVYHKEEWGQDKKWHDIKREKKWDEKHKKWHKKWDKEKGKKYKGDHVKKFEKKKKEGKKFKKEKKDKFKKQEKEEFKKGKKKGHSEGQSQEEIDRHSHSRRHSDSSENDIGQQQLTSHDNFTFTSNGSYLQSSEWPIVAKREISLRFKTRHPHGLLLYHTREHEHEHKLLLLPTLGGVVSPATGNTLRLDQSLSMSAAYSSVQQQQQSQPLLQSQLQLQQQQQQHQHQHSHKRPLNDVHHQVNLLPHELYVRLENGRLRLVYEFGQRLNQTYCGRGLNDDRWHRIDLKVDPDIGQATLTLDSILTVDVSVSGYGGVDTSDTSFFDTGGGGSGGAGASGSGSGGAAGANAGDSGGHSRATNQSPSMATKSILFIGGVDASHRALSPDLAARWRQQLFSQQLQFIGCIGVIVIKTDLGMMMMLGAGPTEQAGVVSGGVGAGAELLPLTKSRPVRLGCRNKCDTDNYCLHRAACINYYTHVKCDCFATNFEDVYCWQRNLTTITMSGHSMLINRIYDWKNRHHSSVNRVGIQFRTRAANSILFFSHGEISSAQRVMYVQQNQQQQLMSSQQQQQQQQQLQLHLQLQQGAGGLPSVPLPSVVATGMSKPPQNNYLAISLAQGQLQVEMSFGEQPIILSHLLYQKINDKWRNQTASTSAATGNNNNKPPSAWNLADGRWHNLTVVHSYRRISLHLDEHSVHTNISSKNAYLYVDPSVYFGGVSQHQLNETRNLSIAFNLRHKFVGCLRSLYYNDQNVLLDLKQGSPNVEYRSPLGKPVLGGGGTCEPQEPSSLPLTFRSGKSYLKFQLLNNKPATSTTATATTPTSAQASSAIKTINDAVTMSSSSTKLASKSATTMNETTVTSMDGNGQSTFNNKSLALIGFSTWNSTNHQTISNKMHKLIEAANRSNEQIGPTVVNVKTATKDTTLVQQPQTPSTVINNSNNNMNNNELVSSVAKRATTKFQFEFKATSDTFFLAGGHLRDLNSHDVGAFWTLQVKRGQMQFTFNYASIEPEQLVPLDLIDGPGISTRRYVANTWQAVAFQFHPSNRTLLFGAGTNAESLQQQQWVWQQASLRSSFELIHFIQLGGDLATFGELSSLPFTGCIRRVLINERSYDPRDFVNNPIRTVSSTVGPEAKVTTATTTIISESVASSAAVLPTTSSAQGVISLDSCQLVDACHAQPCANNGTCRLNDLGDTECDCSKTGYTGRYCHFSVLKQSCEELHLSGQRTSATSSYVIDIDRNGPLRPVRVKCNMHDDDTSQIETIVQHNLPAETVIRTSGLADYYINITYVLFDHLISTKSMTYPLVSSSSELMRAQESALRRIISQAKRCEQSVRYECRSAALNLGVDTWLEAPYPHTHKVLSFGGTGVGQCVCANTGTCLDRNRSCNCDANEPRWTDDSFTFSDAREVGITRIIVMQQHHLHQQQYLSPDNNIVVEHRQQQLIGTTERHDDRTSATQEQQEASGSQHTHRQQQVLTQARLTMGSLHCYGTSDDQLGITFKTNDAFVELPGWRRGDVSFSFRTASLPPAIIMFQLATSRNHGYFRLTLTSDTKLLLEYLVNRRPRKMLFTASHKLNNGHWQQVYIEYDAANLRLSVNDDSQMVDLDPNDYLGTFEGPLFIGGAPSKYLELQKRNGFTGCLRRLYIGGTWIDLRSYLSAHSHGGAVIESCQPSCTKNLCQNGAKCIEYWGSYECECSNPMAHSGRNCEININTNSMTFITPQSYYIQAEQHTLSDGDHSTPAYLDKTLLLSIRTFQDVALILYAHDHLNNFIQLHKNGTNLVLTYNTNNTIVSAQVPIGQLDDLSTLAASHSAGVVGVQTTALLQQTNALHTQETIAQQQQQSISSNINQSAIINVGGGQPIQVKIERHRLGTTFYVNRNFVVLDGPLILMTNVSQYQQATGANNNRSNELGHSQWVRPIVTPSVGNNNNRQRETSASNAKRTGGYSQLFLANVDTKQFRTHLSGFTGCIQGLSIDNQLFDFNRAHLTGQLIGDYRIGCKMHCDSMPCKNQGVCIENWQDDKIQCQCRHTSYTGDLCTEDVAALFNGQTSYIEYRLNTTAKQLTVMATAAAAAGQPPPLANNSDTNLVNEANVVLRNVEQPAGKSSDNNLDNNANFSNQTSTRVRPTTPAATATATSNAPSVLDTTTTSSSSSSVVVVSRQMSNHNSSSRQQNSTSVDKERPETSQLTIVDTFEISIAFSSDLKTFQSASNTDNSGANSLQVLVHITRAASTRFFLLALTLDGNLLIQEDYGHSMALSRLVKRDQPFTDGFRHFVQYSRFGQTTSIVVDNQAYLPSLNVMGDSHVNQQSIPIMIMVGGTKQAFNTANGVKRINYAGCIANLVIAIDGTLIEPISEAFGHNLETVNPLNTRQPSGSAAFDDPRKPINESANRNARKQQQQQQLQQLQPILSLINKHSGHEVSDKMETIFATDVEQGKCAPFRPAPNQKQRPTVDPKPMAVTDKRVILSEPPQMIPYTRNDAVSRRHKLSKPSLTSAPFILSVIFLSLVFVAISVYLCAIQRRYEEEKFRVETPFFHNRYDNDANKLAPKMRARSE
ncbi:Contactin-associated protein-like 5, partial [Fragariocoptes setiger]